VVADRSRSFLELDSEGIQTQFELRHRTHRLDNPFTDAITKIDPCSFSRSRASVFGLLRQTKKQAKPP
jgi:hypothetical protein